MSDIKNKEDSNNNRSDSNNKNFKHKTHFEKDGKLHIEVLTSDEEYKFATLDDNGNVELVDSVDNILPSELPIRKEGEIAMIVKFPNENIRNTKVLEPTVLVEKIKKHMSKYCDLPTLDIELCAYYSLFTWFYRKTNTVGYLRFIGDTGKGKTRLLTVVGDLCFLPTIASGSSSFSGMMRINENYHGTLIHDEGDTKGDKEDQIVKYFNLGFEAGKYFILSDKNDPSKQEVFDPFNPKIIAMRQPFRDNATEARLLSISPHETTNKGIPILLDPGYHKESMELRNQIARFVLEHWTDVEGNKMISLDSLNLEPRLRQLATPITIIFQLWEGGTETFFEYISQRQHDLRKQRALSGEGTIFNLVLSIALGDEKPSFNNFYNSKIEAITPTMIAETLHITTKTVTQTLLSIGFQVEQRYITEIEYLFSWDNVPGTDSESLLRFLRDKLNIDWAGNAKIHKSDDGRTICIFEDENSAKLMIDETEKKVTLKISDGRTHDLKVKKENCKLNIYEKSKKRVRCYVIPDEKTWVEIIQRYYVDEDGTDGTDGTHYRTHQQKNNNGTDGTHTLTINNLDIIPIPKVLKSKKYTCVIASVPSVPSVPQLEVKDVETTTRDIDARAFDNEFQIRQSKEAMERMQTEQI